MNVYDMVVN